jgi:integrase
VAVAKAYRLLNAMLTSAVADELIVRNPCVVKGASQERSPERPMLSIAEVDALAAAIPKPWRTAVELAAWCHLRLGEVLGLERRDVDILHRRNHIERTSYEVGGKLQIAPPKTEAGRRTVSIPPHLISSLEGHLRVFVGPGPPLRSSPGRRAGDWAGIPSMRPGGPLARVLGAQKSIFTTSGEPA